MTCQNCNHDKCTFCIYVDKNIQGELKTYEYNDMVYDKAEKLATEYINKLAEGIFQTYANKYGQKQEYILW